MTRPWAVKDAERVLSRVEHAGWLTTAEIAHLRMTAMALLVGPLPLPDYLADRLRLLLALIEPMRDPMPGEVE